MSFAEAKKLALETYTEWTNDNAPRLGAALAYYTILSLAPLLIVMIAIAGFVLGKEAAQGQLFIQIRDMVGPEGARAIEGMIEGASKLGSGILATLIGVATLLFGASSVVAELRSSMNVIWDVPKNNNGGLLATIKDRGYALALVLGCGFLLLVSLAVSAALAAMGTFMSSLLPLPEAALQAMHVAVSLAVITGIFALLFKFLPEADIRWNDVLLGAALTAVLFTIGQIAIGMYLGKASFGSTYGAAGSLVVVLVWVYYSSQIFFFGAEFTQVYALRRGSRTQKSPMPARPLVVGRPKPAASKPAARQLNGTELGAGVNTRIAAGLGALIGSALALKRAGKGLGSGD